MLVHGEGRLQVFVGSLILKLHANKALSDADAIELLALAGIKKEVNINA